MCGWTLDARLGAGPVADSWLASRAGQSGVVRVLRPPFALDERTRGEWLSASWAANRFHHVRVPKVIEEGVGADGAPVVVRRWAAGEPLDEAVRRGAVDAALALRLAERLLDALEMAHAHGIVHGAIRPSNVIVTARGSMRLVDFAVPPGLLVRRTGRSTALSEVRAGPFTAPELRGPGAAPASEQADIWSAAACLYFAIAGEPPADPPAPFRHAGGAVHPDVAAVIQMALARDPLDRYESAYAMLGDVRRVLAGRKPKLEAAHAPVPSQSAAQLWLTTSPATGPQSTSGLRELESGAEGPRREARGEWKGNALLVAAIALLVGLATFVLVRERLADPPAARAMPSASP